MIADGVIGTPAGLWRWGHQVGIGYRRDLPQSRLVADLLPQGNLTLTKNGVVFSRANYAPAHDKHLEWTTHARNFNRTHSVCHYFPGSASRIWTPYNAENELLELELSEHSTCAPESTFDEIADVYKYDLRHNAARAHAHTMHGIDWRRQAQAQIDQAKVLTGAALEADHGPTPTMSEARAMEAPTVLPLASQQQTPPTPSRSVDDNYLEIMDSILNSAAEHA